MNTRWTARIVCSVIALGAGSVHAHGIWIKQTGETKTLFYGEPENALKEKFPGKLENIKAPQSLLIQADGSRTAG